MLNEEVHNLTENLPGSTVDFYSGTGNCVVVVDVWVAKWGGTYCFWTGGDEGLILVLK